MAKKNSGMLNTSSPLKAGSAQAPASGSYQSSAHPTARAIALPRLSHEQIARRAKAIWEKKGRPSGQDEQNWYQAEAELRTESQA
ncbi:MAG: DUF2934 domain-containing protein [Planctomycetota bacterium]|nr:DUF2934 domain-containing protein [Planctomycetota bacterium]